MSRRTWVDKARAVIWGVILDNPGLPIDELEQRIRAAYPFGVKKYLPYKIWLREVKLAIRAQEWARHWGMDEFRNSEIQKKIVESIKGLPLFKEYRDGET